ncbi:MAG: prepilin-type N-terminal cleavage/methylation domain-containing protein [Candidatus Omnitrophica bacterium]|nr:prepilin-type N-terminal cleavage/methylation domain-containing protein [Candidatus Omnitrophota bacterium]
MKKSLTLVELLLAISIFSVVAVMLYSVFNMGITAWRKMEAVLERYQELRLLLDRMALELHNALDLDIKDFFKDFLPPETVVSDFQGELGKLVFYTLKNGEIRSILYKVEEDKEKKEGLALSVFTLKRSERKFSPVPFKDGEFQEEAVFSLIKELKFFYLERKDEGGVLKETWQENWGKEDKEKDFLPAQVKISIVFYVPVYLPVGRRIDYQEISIEKYVDIITSPRKLL